ncbi:M10 family metallopeptidase C-terminal domain-containing protein, partial [Croceicoccus bisphenolivorans]|uniref:M10 family metallopeptidase C-terminal domain-containing protein n=1 Tax=Croceicoccus bisphenolivorans TaxID=1783232 RepID=UPI000ADD50CE
IFVETYDADGNLVDAGLTLDGTSGDDVLIGDFGNDILSALGGTDTLTGNEGSDTFLFEVLSTDLTTITDFQPGEDEIDLSGIDAIFATPEDDAFEFIGTDPFDGTAGQLRIEVAPEGVTLMGDTNGDQITDFAIFLPDQTDISVDYLIM